MPDWGSLGRKRLYFVDPMEMARLFNNSPAEYTEVAYRDDFRVDDFRVPDLHPSPAINARWDILGVPEAEANDDHVCPSILPPEAVRGAQNDHTVPAHDDHDVAVRLPHGELAIASRFHNFSQPEDTSWQPLRRQEGQDFDQQRDALCSNIGGNYVDNSVDDECQQCCICSSNIEVSSQGQRPTTTPPASATTDNSDGVDLRVQKENPDDPTKLTQQKETRCIEKSVLGLMKTVNARLKKKASSARRLPSVRRSHIFLEREYRQDISALYNTLRDPFQLEINSEISARTDEATVVLEATNRILSSQTWVKELMGELKTKRGLRNFSPVMPTAPATAPAAPAAPALPNLLRPQSHFSANVRLHVSGPRSSGSPSSTLSRLANFIISFSNL